MARTVLPSEVTSTMRVIAGEFRSRRLKTLPGMALRPTPDRLREALFNILAPRIEGATFLDAYAGSGSVGIEALSRGARPRHLPRKALQRSPRDPREPGLPRRRSSRDSSPKRRSGRPVKIHRRHLLLGSALHRRSRVRIRADPARRAHAPLVLAQHASESTLPKHTGKLRRTRVLAHGDNAISFFVVS